MTRVHKVRNRCLPNKSSNAVTAFELFTEPWTRGGCGRDPELTIKSTVFKIAVETQRRSS
jgi:hypothetical protein